MGYSHIGIWCCFGVSCGTGGTGGYGGGSGVSPVNCAVRLTLLFGIVKLLVELVTGLVNTKVDG